MLAVVITPLIRAIFNALFELADLGLTPFDVIRQIAQITFLPVIIGLPIQRFALRLAKVMGKPVLMLVNLPLIVLFVVLVILLVLTSDLRLMLNPDSLSIVPIIIRVAVPWPSAIYYADQSREQRSVFAIASIERNVGLALFIDDLSDYGQNLIPTIFILHNFAPSRDGALLSVD
ncbi:MAG: hypothetical protein ACP5VS_10330 [Desulfomonilaceae bacterium]